jgi:hypothetical protein
VKIPQFDPGFDPGPRRFPAGFRGNLTQEFVLLGRENIRLYAVVGQEALKRFCQYLIGERASEHRPSGHRNEIRARFSGTPSREKTFDRPCATPNSPNPWNAPAGLFFVLSAFSQPA